VAEVIVSAFRARLRTTVTGSAIARLIYLRSGRDGSVAIRPERIGVRRSGDPGGHASVAPLSRGIGQASVEARGVVRASRCQWRTTSRG
jgi:hypothetical protein